MKRAIVFVVAVLIFEFIAAIVANAIDPIVRTHLALDTVNGGATELATMRTYNVVRDSVWPRIVMYAVFLLLLYGGEITNTITRIKKR